jgi:hypothetical protein
VRIAAFGETSADPMLREIEEILDDSNDAVLRRSEGSIDRALDTVFDPRALSGQEEDVHRALIEAFGTSRRPTPTFGGEVAIVTNPAPRFEGISRAVPPEIASTARGATPSASDASSVPTRTFEEIAASSMARSSAPEYAGEKPFEPAFPSVPPIAPAVVDEHPIAVAMPVTTPIPAATVVATNTPPAAEVPAPSTGVSAPGTPPVSVAATSTTTDADRSTPEISANSDEPRRPSMIATLLARTGRIIASVALLPAQLCALPMRFVPANARNYVSVAAISMALWVPVAWWMAERSTQAPGIGRVEFPVAPAAGHAEGDATDEHADGKTDSHPDASHDAEPNAHTSEPAGGHH